MPADSDAFLRLVDVHKSFRDQTVLDGVSLTIQEGENMVVIGRSGGGKSVMLKHIMGLVRPDRGHVWFRNQNLAQLGEEEITPLRKEMGMLFQNGALFDSLNVGENVAFSMREAGADESTIHQEVARALKIVDLPGQEQKMPSELSGGMRKRVALARAAVSRPKLMMYDEPTAGLDPVVADSINKLIVRLGNDLNMTNIIVTHDMVSAYTIADRIAMLYEGRIRVVDSPGRIKDSSDEVVHNFINGISDESKAIF
ncbi:MAG: ATP-binding cassette domain-containing protein [Verrucomicrobiota bacterium]